MKITGVRATPVNIPLEVPFLFSVGTYPGDTKVIVEVLTDAGLVGLGEAPSPDCADVINKHLGPALAGLNPFDLQACERACVPDIQVMPNTADSTVLKSFGGIELGLWDIRGKAFGLPLYMLLGVPAESASRSPNTSRSGNSVARSEASGRRTRSPPIAPE